MRVFTLLLALVAVPSGSWASPITIGAVGDGGNFAIQSACGFRIPDCSLTFLTVVNFNLQTPAQLAADYDVLFFGYNAPLSVDATWTTRLAPYMANGGSVIFESPQNVIDLLPLATGTAVDSTGNLILVATVPILTSGFGFSVPVVNSHIQFTSYSSALAPFLMENSGPVVGLFGSVGAGRIVITGPDNSYHGVDGSSGPEDNMFELLVNEVLWVTAEPPSPVPEPATLLMVSLGAAGWGIRRIRRRTH